MEDLTRAGYKYKQPRAGDYIMAINETIGFREKIRIVSYESSYDVTGRLIKHKVTCNDIGTVQKAITSEGSIMRSVSESREYAEGALSVATRALVSANGKNTNYYGAKKPEDNPRGTLHEGDLLYLTVGEETELYYWSGTEWLLKILKVDTAKIEKIVNNAQTSANQSIAQANAKAEEALKKAGTLPDTSKLSDQIKQQILSSPDLQNKVTEGVNSVDGDTIYSKIVSKVSRNFATKGEFENIDRVQNSMGRDLIGLSKQIATQTVEFNKLTESNKVFERILGTSETGAPDKLSRLVMSSQIFQTEVGKYSTSGGPNMLRNSRADDGLKYWTEANGRLNFTAHQFYLNGQKRMFSLRPGAFVHSPRFIIKQNTNYMLNLIAFDDNTARFKIAFCKRRKGSTNDFDEMQIIFDKTSSPAFNSERAVKKSFSFNTGAFDEGYLLFNYQGNPNGWSGLFMTELDFYEGSSDRLWQPSPDDSLGPLEAVRTQVTQLAGSYSINNINSAGDILGQLNLNKDGSIKLNEALIAIGEKTYVKDGVIKKAMIGDGQIGTAHIGEIDANIARLINVSAKNIVSDGLTANIIRGGVLASKNGKLKFDLDNSALESTSDESVVKRIGSGTNFPTQFLKFSKGWVQGRSQPVGMTILGSNRYGDGRSEDGNSGDFAGIRIWNGSNAEGYADSVDVVGDEIVLCDSPFQNRNGWLMKTTYSDTSLFAITNKINSRIYAGDFLFEKAGGGNASLRQILWQIGDNIAQLYKFRAQNNEGTPGWNDTNNWGWS